MNTIDNFRLFYAGGCPYISYNGRELFVFLDHDLYRWQYNETEMKKLYDQYGHEMSRVPTRPDLYACKIIGIDEV